MPGHGGWGDTVTGDAVACISPSVGPGTTPLGEMHRNIFLFLFTVEGSLFPHVPEQGVPDPWPLSSSCSQHSGKAGPLPPKSCRYQGTRLIFSDTKASFFLLSRFLSCMCSQKKSDEMRGDFFPPALAVVKAAAKTSPRFIDLTPPLDDDGNYTVFFIASVGKLPKPVWHSTGRGLACCCPLLLSLHTLDGEFGDILGFF